MVDVIYNVNIGVTLGLDTIGIGYHETPEKDVQMLVLFADHIAAIRQEYKIRPPFGMSHEFEW